MFIVAWVREDPSPVGAKCQHRAPTGLGSSRELRTINIALLRSFLHGSLFTHALRLFVPVLLFFLVVVATKYLLDKTADAALLFLLFRLGGTLVAFLRRSRFSIRSRCRRLRRRLGLGRLLLRLCGWLGVRRRIAVLIAFGFRPRRLRCVGIAVAVGRVGQTADGGRNGFIRIRRWRGPLDRRRGRARIFRRGGLFG